MTERAQHLKQLRPISKQSFFRVNFDERSLHFQNVKRLVGYVPLCRICDGEICVADRRLSDSIDIPGHGIIYCLRYPMRDAIDAWLTLLQISLGRTYIGRRFRSILGLSPSPVSVLRGQC